MRARNLFATIAVVVLAVGTIGCWCDNSANEVEEKNMSVVRYVHAEIAKGNVAVFGEVLSPDYVRHCQAMPPGQQELKGTTEFMGFINEFLGAVSDFHETIDLMMAEDDKVAYITTMYGKQTGEMGGLPPSGKEFKVVNIIIHRLVDEKIVETWVSWDNVAMLSQLGFFPPPPPPEQP